MNLVEQQIGENITFPVGTKMMYLGIIITKEEKDL